MRNEDQSCPECGGPMVERTNRKDFTKFWGCAQYPSCTGTRPAEGDGKDDAAPSDRYRNNDKNRWRE